MNPAMVEIITDPSMYRTVGDGPPVWPRHYSQFSSAFTGTAWTIAPLMTDADIHATIRDRTNFTYQLIQWWKYYEARPAMEPSRPCFEMLHAYLIHCVFAPIWTPAYDEWLVKVGREPWKMSDVADAHGKALLEVETPAEMAECVEAMLRDGMDFLSPVTPADEEWLARMRMQAARGRR